MWASSWAYYYFAEGAFLLLCIVEEVCSCCACGIYIYIIYLHDSMKN